jgi:tripartite-type tricarboxylate transporter receptor subunit TctC
MFVILSSLSFAQNYPSRPVRVVTPEPGSIVDVISRMLSTEVAKSMRQPFIVDNRPSSLIGTVVLKSAPDGYTLLISGSVFWLGPLLQKTAYDPVSDFEAITGITMSPMLLVINPSVPAKSVAELIALAKAQPGALDYANTGIGGAIHLASELFKSTAGINVVAVNYKGAGDALNSVIGGETQMAFTTNGLQSMQLAKQGKLRVLAVSSAQPTALFPGIPTVASAGLTGFEAGNTLGLFAPGKTPAAIISQLNEEFVRVLNAPDVKEKLLNIGAEPIAGPADRFSAYVKADIARIGKVIKEAGLGIQ